MTINIFDEKLSDRFIFRFKHGVEPLQKFIDGKIAYFFPDSQQPSIWFKNKKRIGKVVFVTPDGTVGLELDDKGGGINYMFNSKQKKHVTIG